MTKRKHDNQSHDGSVKKLKSSKHRNGSDTSEASSAKVKPVSSREEAKLLRKKKLKEADQQSRGGAPESSEVVKLRLRRKRKRKQLWNNLVKVVQAVENAPKIVSQFETAEELKKIEKENTGLNEHVLGQTASDTWDSHHINAAPNFHAWLSKAKAALPSTKGQTPNQEILTGKYFRQFKLASDLIYAKCAYTDDDKDQPFDMEEHAKEATSPQHLWFRKNFDYYQHWQTIKAFPCSIKKKKKMLKYLKAEVEIFQEMKVKTRKRKFQLHIWWEKSMEILHNTVETFKFWRNPIRVLHARFGVEVHYYFTWLRKLLVLESVYLFFGICFICLPEFVKHGCHLDHLYPPCRATKTECHFYFIDLLDGAGSYETKCIYYHSYEIKDALTNRQQNDVAYLMVVYWLFLVLFNAIVAFIRMANSKKFVKAATGKGLVYFNEVFCAWDFSMNSIELAKAKQEAISKELTYINSHVQNLKHRTQNEREGRKLVKFLKSCFPKHGNKVYHWTVNVIVLNVAILTASCLWYLLMFRYREDWEKERNSYFWSEGLYISGLANIVCPIIVYISDLQVWSTGRKVRNYWVVSRLTLIYACNYVMIWIFWYQPDDKCCERSLGNQAGDQNDDVCRCFNCYETKMSEQVYCILVWEFIFSTIYTVFKEFVFHFLIKKIYKKYKAPEPEQSSSFVKMVFLHFLLALVIQFGPLLAAFSILLYILKFYLERLVLLMVYSHPKYQLHPGDYEMPYFVSYFTFFLLGTFCSLHIFSTASPSANCGPFQNISRNHDGELRFYRSIVKVPGVLSIKFAEYIWDGILSAGAGFSLVILISGAVYIFSRWSHAHKERTTLHQDLLQLERQDRNFLLRAIYNFSTRENQIKEKEQELVLDHNQIFRIKLRFIAALIVAGRRHALSKQYIQTKEYKEFLKREKKSFKPNEHWRARKRRQTLLQTKLESTSVATPKETIEARRMSLITRFLYHTETIRLAHAASRRERQNMWQVEMAKDAKDDRKSRKGKHNL